VNSTVAKVAGWLQFAGQFFSQVASSGLPHNAVGWAGLAGSLLLAVGMHAAGTTDGSK